MARNDNRARIVRQLAAVAAVLALAGCKSGDPATGSSVSQLLPDDLPAGVPGTLEALAAFFVESFDEFEGEAASLRTKDPRFTVQRNSWRFASRGAKTYKSYPYAASRLEYAHAAGLTGAGQTVSVVDAGFLTSHEVFAGTELRFPVGPLPVDAHGTSVASIVAGDSESFVGYAPNADLALGYYGSMSSLTAATDLAISLGAVAQNNSWGYAVDVGPDGYQAVFGDHSSYLTALEIYAQTGVVVFAVSNDRNRTTGTLMEALPAIRPDLENGWLAVANAVPEFNDERIVSAELLSAGCLDAARWCLVADGSLYSASSAGDTEYRFGTGSSFAAPQVSGALALLAEAFPDLTPHELRVRLLASADNGFFSPDGTVELAPGFFHDYAQDLGHGFLDLRAALLPIGEPVVPMAGGAKVRAGRPIVVAGGAVGDAVVRSLGDTAVLVTDSLGGDFRMDAGALVARTEPAPLLANRLARLSATDLGSVRWGGAEDEANVLGMIPAGSATFADPGGAFEVSLLVPSGSAESFGVAVDRTVGGMTFGASLVRDTSGALGLSPFGSDSAGVWAAAVDLGARAALSPKSFVSLYGQVGVMSAPSADGLTSVSASRFGSLGIDLGRSDAFRAGDAIGFGVSLPTAVTSGSASMLLPTGRSAGSVTYDEVDLDLAPRDREVRLTLSYQAPLGRGWSFLAEGVHAINRGNVAGESDTGALLGIQARF